jgi:outer membrane protein TolC
VGLFGPAVRLPFFPGGRLAGAYRGAAAEYEAAVAAYDKTVSDALKDVADAVSLQRALAVQLDYAGEAVTDSRKAYDLAVLRYKGGLSPYLVVLTAQSTLIAQERAAADLKAQTHSATVAHERALGGGFTVPAVADSSTISNERGPAHG